MEQIQLDVHIRKEQGTSGVRKVRRQNLIPAVIYGDDLKSTPIAAERRAYERITREHAGESVIFTLNLLQEGKKVKEYPAIVKEVQVNPVTDQVLHIDFHKISLDKEIEVKIPVVAKGEAIGVKRDGGTLDHHMWELDIVCLPTKIPHHVEVDITNLAIHDAIHVKDLALPAGVKTKHDPEAVVVTVVGSIKEFDAAAEAEAAAAPGEVEVIKEKKKEEGAEAAPAAGKAKEEPAKKKEEPAKKAEEKK